MTGIDFGRRQLHDPRSRDHAYRRTVVEGINVRHPLRAPHVDQFYLSGCVGFSGTNLLNTTIAIRSRQRFNAVWHKASNRYLGNTDGITNYTEATISDPFPGQYPPDDTGSSAIGLMKSWKHFGVIRDYKWPLTFSDFLAALQRQPVLLGTWWYDDMMQTDAKGIVHTELAGDHGGHEYLANAILWDRKLIGCEQSWGQHPPGFRPTFYLPFATAEALLADDGDCAVPGLL